jgi:hypothetical protein
MIVGITVVLAAVLYVMVADLTRTSPSAPYELSMTEVSATMPASNTYVVTMALSPSAGITTGIVGLKVMTSGQGWVANVDPSAGCAPGVDPSTSCVGTTGGWYGVLVGPNRSVAATYGSEAWAYPNGVTTIGLNSSYELWVVTYTPVTGSGDVIYAFGTGLSPVSGSQYL